MDNKQAQDLINDVLQHKFNREKFINLIRNLLNDFEPRDNHYIGNYIPDPYREHIHQYWRIGKYVSPTNDEMDILIVEVKSLSKLNTARTSLRNFAIKCLDTFGKDYSLIAFYAKDNNGDNGEDWRFSYIKREYTTHLNQLGKVKTKTDTLPARRYSFLVGEHENCYTACKQLLPLLEASVNPTLETIEQAFSIEKVTNEFFQQYKELYIKLSEHLATQALFISGTEEENRLKVARFAKKLLGQIVFLYFLQKKGWLGVEKNNAWGTGDKKFLSNRFQQISEQNQNYYRDFLQFLFYEALAQQHGADSWYAQFNCKIPFLNGGLFDAGYEWKTQPLNIPDALFRNTDSNKAGDIGIGILDVFDRYNFTIKEDEPLEKEVAVDPEMLGKVFENMLDITERKSKGAFYTPREIVHYMCQESLIHYLQDAVPEIEKADIEAFIRNGLAVLENDKRVVNEGKETKDYSFKTPESIRLNAEQLDNKLAQLKICDPAIGSGAFPVGLLHEVVNARLLLQLFTPKKYTAYSLKLHCIQQSIYGVDLDASAVDISRLRLWLSLIVDYDKDDANEIKALPNLDYKIIQGNSLLSITEKGRVDDIFNPLFVKITELEQKKLAFFDATDKEKKQLDNEIKQLFSEVTQGNQLFDFKIYFSEVWHEKNGFDIVIGNPPYIQIQKFSGQQCQKDWQNQHYQTFQKTGDIYALFIEKGVSLLKQNGVLTFITSNKWMRAGYGKSLRKFLAEKTKPLQLIDFGSYQVFESATVDSNILMTKNRSPIASAIGEKKKIAKAILLHENNKTFQACTIQKDFTVEMPLADYFTAHKQTIPLMSEEAWVISSSIEQQIKAKIVTIGTPLKDWDVNIYRGIVTGFNEAFIIDTETKERLCNEDPKSAEIIKPVLRGQDNKRYSVKWAELWLIFAHRSYEIEQYKAIYSYLLSHKCNLEKRLNVIRDKEFWWQIPYAISYSQEFEKEKIVWGNLALRSQCSFVDKGFYINAPCSMITPANKYILAVLNSTVADHYIRKLGVTRSGGYFEYKPMFIEQLPIPKILPNQQQPLIDLVDKILIGKKIGENTAHLEREIDQQVYALYGLTEDEIKIVEGGK